MKSKSLACMVTILLFCLSPPLSIAGEDTEAAAVASKDNVSADNGISSGVITLEDALSLALAHNPELAAYSKRVEAAQQTFKQERLLPNPEFEVEVENFGGDDEFEGYDNSEVTYSISQELEFIGAYAGRVREATLEQSLAKWDYESRRQDVIAETTESFYRVLADQERLDLSADNLALAERVYNAVAEKADAGKVSPVEKTRARVDLSMAGIENENARAELMAARRGLSAKWGEFNPGFEKVEGDLEAIQPGASFEELYEEISKNPDVARWEDELELGRARVKTEKARTVPDVTVRGGVREIREVDETAYVASLSLPVPIFDANQNQVRRSGIELSRIEQEKRASEIQARTELADACNEYSAAYFKAVTLRDEVLPDAEKAFQAVEKGYRFGKFDYLEMLDAQKTFFETRQEYIEALEACHRVGARLDRLVGKGLAEVR